MSLIVKKLNTLVDAAVKPLNDKRVATPLTILLILYSGLLAGTPSKTVRSLLSRPIVRVAAVFLLSVMMAKGDRTLALTSTIAVIVTMVAATNMDLLGDLMLAVDQVRDLAEDTVEDVVDVIRGSRSEPAKKDAPTTTEIQGA
jgi:phosphoserine phosphatase